MSSITTNQRQANQSRAQEALRGVVPAMLAMSEPERFTILARLAAATNTPTELVFLGEQGDEHIIAPILDGVLPRGQDQYAWQTSSGCEARLVMLPGEEDHHE